MSQMFYIILPEFDKFKSNGSNQIYWQESATSHVKKKKKKIRISIWMFVQGDFKLGYDKL